MASFDIKPVQFALKVTGEITGEEYSGIFKVKPILTHGEQLARDQIMRDLLGPRPTDASGRAQNQAFLLAEIQARTVEAPPFWRDSRQGMDLLDDAVVAAIYDKIQAAEAAWRKDVADRAAAAKASLEHMAPSQP